MMTLLESVSISETKKKGNRKRYRSLDYCRNECRVSRQNVVLFFFKKRILKSKNKNENSPLDELTRIVMETK